MNARVDPLALHAPRNDDGDSSLIALSRSALRALERDLALDEAFNKLSEREEASRPLYPRTHRVPMGMEGASSKELQALARKNGNPPVCKEGRIELRAHIADVVAWERACAELKRSLGVDRVWREYQRAMDESQRLVELLAATEAQTLMGAAYKSTVVSQWLTAGYAMADLGEQLILSVLADVRRLGGPSTTDVSVRRRRRVA